MKQEQLSPNLSILQLQEHLKELTAIFKQLKTNPYPQIPGRLRISQKGKYTEYYHIINAVDSNNTNSTHNGKYIPKKQREIACQLAQKDYDSKIVSLVEDEIAALKTYLTIAPNIQAFYKTMCPARQKLITPLTLTNEQYASQWKTEPYQGLPFAPNAPVYTTNQGERVRSKSEVLIANALAQHKIPYRYEYPLTLNRNHTGSSTRDTPNKTTLYPDFLCLNLRTRQEFIWEHFGLMDSQEYVSNTVSKLNLYAQNKITPGKNFIITMETATEPLTPFVIEQMISDFLL